MFERYLSEALTTHFGHLIQNLDSDKVRLSAWRGELVLEDLLLRKNALDSLLSPNSDSNKTGPVEISYGRVGHLELHIPWKLLRKKFLRQKSLKTPGQPPNLASLGCSIILSDVNILITPRQNHHQRCDETKQQDSSDDQTLSIEDHRIQKEKEVQQLMDANLLLRLARPGGGEEQQQPENRHRQRLKWAQTLITNVLTNLSVTVRNIHIRYEDPGNCMGFVWSDTPSMAHRTPFAAGITLLQFSVETAESGFTIKSETQEPSSKVEEQPTSDTEVEVSDAKMIDSEGEKRNTGTTHRMRHKVAAAEQLAAYWDSDCNLISVNLLQMQESRNEASSSLFDDKDGSSRAASEDDGYITSAFSVLNNITGGRAFVDRNLYARKHSYLLDPVSPSLHFSIADTSEVTKGNIDDVATEPTEASFEQSDPKDGSCTDSLPNPPNQPLIPLPPSTLVMTSPPCYFAIARNALEDIVYIRESLELWGHSRKVRIPESAIQYLTKLRPKSAPLADPRSWWKYAFKAIVAMSRLSQGDIALDETSRQKDKRNRGWLKLARALGQRQRYIRLYRELLVEPDDRTNHKINATLAEIEDELCPEEIVAFRFSVFTSTAVDQNSSEEASDTGSSSKWRRWVSTFNRGNTEPEFPGDTNHTEVDNDPSDQLGVSLSWEHRRRMCHEMSHKLDREMVLQQSQEVSQTSDDILISPSPVFGREESNAIVWKASLIYPELSLQINDLCLEKDVYGTQRLREKPIVRVSCALTQQHQIFQDASWDANLLIASLEARDLTSTVSEMEGRVTLLGPKQDRTPKGSGKSSDPNRTNKVININGLPHRHSASININRTFELHSKRTDSEQAKSQFVLGSTTRTRIRLSPLEVVYATDPVEALTRVFSTMKTPELSDDYHRMASLVSEWRRRQKQRLFRALAHRSKQIILDVDIAAPVILVPEDLKKSCSPMLVVDLGRLQFSNTDAHRSGMSDYDDKWQLVLSNTTIMCSTTSVYWAAIDTLQSATVVLDARSHQLVEPFSIEFEISTRIADDTLNDAANQTHIRTSAKLPLLAFNLTSSAVRLVSRLQLQWAQRKAQTIESSSHTRTSTTGVLPSNYRSLPWLNMPHLPRSSRSLKPQRRPLPSNDGYSERVVEFIFSAPIIAFKLENDVDGRDCGKLDDGDAAIASLSTTPLVDLALRGIRGAFVQDTSSIKGISSTFHAKLGSLDAVDLYQTAGSDFALLLSSVSPESLSGTESFSWQSYLERKHELISPDYDTDLVSIQYISCQTNSDPAQHLTEQDDGNADKLSICFHELFVEWNPESIAAIQKAMRTPQENEGKYITEMKATADETVPRRSSDAINDSRVSEGLEDEFFDAVQDDASLDEYGSFHDSEDHLIYGIASPRSASVSDLPVFNSVQMKNWHTPLQYDVTSPFKAALSPVRRDLFNATNQEQKIGENSEDSTAHKRPFEVIFDLSKLRVRFNKDARHRRLLAAEMDGTYIRCLTKPIGGSKYVSRIGNLSFSDPTNAENHSLYREILGPKTDTSSVPTSLFEMELDIQPKVRRLVPRHNSGESPPDSTIGWIGVTIDHENGEIIGQDISVKIHFSPMRFVYLQQLWFEIVDYFFEGIVGFEVWGKQRRDITPKDVFLQAKKASPDLNMREHLSGIDAKGITFTRVHITMDAPLLLMPVSYLSPQYIRLEFGKWEISNHFSGKVELTEGIIESADGIFPNEHLQWYNNYSMGFERFRIVSWCGTVLSRVCPEAQVQNGEPLGSTERVDALVNIKWPIGPTAVLIKPKWNVDCSFDSMNIFLRREDYALFQHIVTHNVGEASRHLEEWNSLQNLPLSELKAYKENIMVHFGYDKKDSVPTTFSIQLSIPRINCFLVKESGAHGSDDEIAKATCTGFVWRMKKLSDRISRQRISCDITLAQLMRDTNAKGYVDLLLPLENSEILSTNSDSHIDRDAFRNMLREKETPELIYTSTSRPSGDNIKTLEIVDACINLVYPAWIRIGSFFKDLPEPPMMTIREAQNSIQIGDRWYRLGSDSDQQNAFKTDETNQKQHTGPNSDGALPLQCKPSFQFRLLLTSPHIVLDSTLAHLNRKKEECANVIISLTHLDYLHINDAGKITRSFFVHDLELYLSSFGAVRGNLYKTERSLIHPWCISGLVERCNGHNLGNCKQHSTKVSADTLRARAAYSDIKQAIDASLSFLTDYRSANNCDLVKPDPGEKLNIARDLDVDRNTPGICLIPSKTSIQVGADGFQLLVVDDSRRHFANAQELIVLSLGEIYFIHEAESPVACDDSWQLNQIGNEPPCMRYRTNVGLRCLDLFDCLQSSNSPFRLAATGRSSEVDMNPAYNADQMSSAKIADEEAADIRDSLKHYQPLGSPDHLMSWDEFTVELETWGFTISKALSNRILIVEQTCIYSLSNEPETSKNFESVNSDAERPYLVEFRSLIVGGHSHQRSVTLRPLTLQWNPSTMIALQRFLGRLKKEFKSRMAIISGEPINDSSPRSNEASGGMQPHPKIAESTPLHTSIRVESLTVCLNKEHQNRRLLYATLSGSHIVIEHSQCGVSIDGSVDDLTAYDPDNYIARGNQGIDERNRVVLKVAGLAQNSETHSNGSDAKTGTTTEPISSVGSDPFLKFHYKTFVKSSIRPKQNGIFPGWIQSQFAKSEIAQDIDDFLSTSIATLEFTYIRERTEELLDYLSNGLPGKGMGATSKAAQGFINKRIETRSFLDLRVDAPQVRVPQHENATGGLMLRFGDVNVKSWFEEGTIDGVGDIINAEAHRDVEKGKLGKESQPREWWRVVSLAMLGMDYSKYDHSDTIRGDASNLPVDLYLVLHKPTWHGKTITIRGELSFVDLTLKYSEYILLRAVLRDNIGRKIDVSRWDNIEKAFWIEEARLESEEAHDQSLMTPMVPFTQDKPSISGVTYASDARFIRYGTTVKKGNTWKETESKDLKGENESQVGVLPDSNNCTEQIALDFKFDLGGLALTIHRDDIIDDINEEATAPELLNLLNYDVALFRVQRIDVMVSMNSSGEKSFQLALYRIGLFDLGDTGRLAREQFVRSSTQKKGTQKAFRSPCAFSVLAEGYSPLDKKNHIEASTPEDPQLLVTVNTAPSSSIDTVGSVPEGHAVESSRVIVARIVLNYLSVNAIFRPFREVAAFATCSWPTGGHESEHYAYRISEAANTASEKPAYFQSARTLVRNHLTSTGFQIKLVAHYPRVFFVSNESDPHSRALVLRGLAVVNGSLMKQTEVMNVGTLNNQEFYATDELRDEKAVIAIDTQFHSMESYINEDVSRSFSAKYQPAQGNNIQEQAPNGGHMLGVALIEPVTAGVDFVQVRRDRFPTMRTVCVSMEPVSTMISFEDLTLIEAVLRRWSSGRGADENFRLPEAASERFDEQENVAETAVNTFDIVFLSPQLGLQLRRNASGTLVDSIQDSKDTVGIEIGDDLIAINGEAVALKPLNDIVWLLKIVPRPTTLTFFRPSSPSVPEPLPDTGSPVNERGQSKLEAVSTEILTGDEAAPMPILNNAYSLEFYQGMPSGISIEKSACSNVPVVTGVEAAFFDAIDTPERQKFRIPRVGTIIVSISADESEAFGYSSLSTLLAGLETKGPPGKNIEGVTNAKYIVRFLEVDSLDWGNVDQVDVTVSGVALTFIDDFRGRDMPIIRGNLQKIELHLQRGYGVQTTLLDDLQPSVLVLPKLSLASYLNVNSPSNAMISAETIVKFSASARTGIDCYHSSIAVWEPLLEPSQLCVLVEWQSKTDIKPGCVAVMISDRVPEEYCTHNNVPLVRESICVNLTDAAAQVLVLATVQWNEWRKSVQLSAEEWVLGEPSNTGSPQDAEETQNWIKGADVSTQDAIHSKDLNERRYKHNYEMQETSLVQSTDNSKSFTHSALPKNASEFTLEKQSAPETARHAAAQKATQAALLFAQKRGAGIKKKGNSAKPFVFRNRTGLSLAFFPRTRGKEMLINRAEDHPELPPSFFSKYRKDIPWCDPSSITELADGNDARFQMDVVADDAVAMFSSKIYSSDASKKAAKKVRNYDGQELPRLTVVLESVSGVTLEPIASLPVFKVGSTVRLLLVITESARVSPSVLDQRGDAPEQRQHSCFVPLIWTVEIQNNRRILTLSSAVRIQSLGLSTGIEIGVRRMLTASEEIEVVSVIANDGSEDTCVRSDLDVVSIGSAQPGLPFYLPLWLALKFDHVDIYLRPKAMQDTPSNIYSWGNNSILEFVPVLENGSLSTETAEIDSRSDSVKWVWRETFQSSRSISCSLQDDSGGLGANTVFLSCYSSTQTPVSSDYEPEKMSGGRTDSSRDAGNMLTISVDAGLTIRNLLPLSVEWEVAKKQHLTMVVVDGSSLRKQKLANCGYVPLPHQSLVCPTETHCILRSGDCTEVFACDTSQMNIEARFRCSPQHSWSEWIDIGLMPQDVTSEVFTNEDGSDLNLAKNNVPAESTSGTAGTVSIRQMNIQMVDELGAPLTIGMRLLPKLSKDAPDALASVCVGVDVILYASLWLNNQTSLPLVFGCPSMQLQFRREDELNDRSGRGDESASRVAAEAALEEIASVLEFGDKGKNLNSQGDDVDSGGDLHLLPNQHCEYVCEEVFEYVEIESSVIKRRWWASEKHDSCRQKPSDFAAVGVDWQWIDQLWQIDCSGQAQASQGGWESSSNLFDRQENAFSGRRLFNPRHSFRRRRFFRRRTGSSYDKHRMPYDFGLLRGINAFHQPVVDSFSRAQRKVERKAKAKPNIKTDMKNVSSLIYDRPTQISIKCCDGNWSSPVVLPDNGNARGVIRVLASRWPSLTRSASVDGGFNRDIGTTGGVYEAGTEGFNMSHSEYGAPNLSTGLFELAYKVTDLSGDWGDFSRVLTISSRYQVKNDSSLFTLEVKQTGALDHTAICVEPTQIVPFYWADMRLPKLVSVRTLVNRKDGSRFYRWSGGFDVCNLGMTAIRIRHSRTTSLITNDLAFPTLNQNPALYQLRSVRAHVEIRPGTDGSGINISLREEDRQGDASLFRIENMSPFPIWVAQDGVLANPTATVDYFGASQTGIASSELKSDDWADCDHLEADGDLVLPMSRSSFSLDVPFRQGKYAGRRAASMAELVRVRVGLSPLSTREGIESIKVIGFTDARGCIRLNPTKLTLTISANLLKSIKTVRVLGVVTTDGPTKVLRFQLMQKANTMFGSAFSDSVAFDTVSFFQNSRSSAQPISLANSKSAKERTKTLIVAAAGKTASLLASRRGVPGEEEAMKLGFFGKGSTTPNSPTTNPTMETDQYFSFHANIGSIVLSLVDSSPSEIAAMSFKNVSALAKWNALRTSEASALISIGWLQIDNHVPSAPFPVAVCPDYSENDQSRSRDSQSSGEKAPLLMIGLNFAPKHKSGIQCLRSVTVSPRNLVIAVDLASIVRLQRFVVDIQEHVARAQYDSISNEVVASVLNADTKKAIPFPDSDFELVRVEDSIGSSSQKLYFEGLTILPCNIKLSVAPCRSLTSAQAAIQGRETSAIHVAVRKGDVLIGGNGTNVLGVNIGHKNKTALAVFRGVFKSIVVDALLRCNGASLDFSGVSLRNHFSTQSQLTTYLAAHYMQSLRNNLPSLLGSLSAFGNPLGLIRGLGDGVSDFVSEPVKGLKRSVEELDPAFVVDGVARGTESLARHAVGGFADSASLLTETFSKNMAVLTLDRRYAQRRDQESSLRGDGEFSATFATGVESAVAKLVQGVVEGVTGVVQAPMRGAEKRGVEGFAKGIGKGLLGLLVKPVIGISDAATDVMIGVKGSIKGGGGSQQHAVQLRPQRPMYGSDRMIRTYQLADAVASALMMRTRLAGEFYLSHCDMGDRVALLSVKRMLLVDLEGGELLTLKFRHVKNVAVRQISLPEGSGMEWGLLIFLKVPRKNGSEIEVIRCKEKAFAEELSSQLNRGVNLVANDT